MAGRSKYPLLNKNDILNNLVSTEELRNFTKTLNDYKKITDFEKLEIDGGEITKGQYNTLKRLRKAEKGRRTRKINTINKTLEILSNSGIEGRELIQEKNRLQSLTEEPKSYNEFIQQIKYFERLSLKNDIRGWNNYRTNYIKRILELGKTTNINMDEIIKKINNMSISEFKSFSQSHELSERYDLNDLITVQNLFNDFNMSMW